MIKIVFDNERPQSWAHEVTNSLRLLGTLRAQGVPCVGRLVITGVERGELTFAHDCESETFTFTFREPGEIAGATFTQTHRSAGCAVFKSGTHFEPHAAEDLF